MAGLYIFAGIILFFWLLLQINAGVRVSYNSSDAESLKAYAYVGFFKLRILPAKPKKIKKKKRFKLFRRKKTVKKAVEKKVKEKQEAEEKQKYKLGEIIIFAKDIGLIIFEKLKKYLKIKIYKANINIGADDAYKTAQLYANITQAAYYLHEIAQNNFNIKIKNININSDFLSEKINFDIDIKISMKLGAGLNTAVSAAMAFLKFRAKNNNNINKNINEESENKWQTAT